MPDDTTAANGGVTVIGVVGDVFDSIDPVGRSALFEADLVVGESRLVDGLTSWVSRVRPDGPPLPVRVVGDDIDEASRQAAAAVGGGHAVCVLASGDPGFFGMVRALLLVVDRRAVRVLPAPSSVSIAFARLGLPWDDAAVVAVGGRPLDDAVRTIRLARKAAVLTSVDAPPEAVGRALVEARAAVDMVAVCSRLGFRDESITMVGLDQLATGTWDPLSVVVLIGPAGRPIAGWGGVDGGGRPLAWGLPDDAYGHRDGIVSRSEVRAVALGKLALPPAGVVWDVGAGSGSVSVEASSLCPGLTVFAIEEHHDDAARISENAARFGVEVRVVHGRAPEACDGLPDPDRVYVGGGGLEAIDTALTRLRPGGRIVATFTSLEWATAAAERLGYLIQLSTSRGRSDADGSWRLTAEDPIFVAWGPRDDGSPGAAR